ncbi:glycosyl hydrolase family 28 protein [Kiritimatiellota bacterium B12222]|nr:glycosyl hydrolase family 28 protein [Kiritimatiellota bacterium B12222]
MTAAIFYPTLPSPDDATDSIQEAIDLCHLHGGGQVVIPPGLHHISSLELKSNVELHLHSAAILQGIFNSPKYRAIKPEEHEMTALIFACDAENISLTGNGTIDAQGFKYWEKLDKPRTGRKDYEEVGAIQFWYQHLTNLHKPHRLLAFLRCKNLKIQDLHLTNAVSWTCHLIGSENIKIRGLNITNPIEGPNTDGIDIDGSSDVFISDCSITTGDDAIVLKNKNIFPLHKAIRNVTVTNCRFTTGCNGFKIGTETEDDVENICVSNCSIYSPDDFSLMKRCITGIAIESVDGGHVRNVVCSNITMINARTPLFIRLGAMLRGKRSSAGSIKGVSLSNIVATGATHPSVISGIPGHVIENVQMNQIQIESKGGYTENPDALQPVPEHPADYPEVFMFGTVPASILYLRHVKRLDIGSFFTELKQTDARPLIFKDDVENFSSQ